MSILVVTSCEIEQAFAHFSADDFFDVVFAAFVKVLEEGLVYVIGEGVFYYIILGNATVFLIFALGTYDLCVCLGFGSGYTSYFVLKDLIGSYVRMSSLLYRGYTSTDAYVAS